MLKYVLPSALILALAGLYALAQTYVGPPNPTAAVCAFNTTAPSPVNGQFYYIQCNSSGQIIVQ